MKNLESLRGKNENEKRKDEKDMRGKERRRGEASTVGQDPAGYQHLFYQ